MLAINSAPPSEYLVADKGSDRNVLRCWLIQRVIPSKSNRKIQIKYVRQIYRQRNFVKRMFCSLQDSKLSSATLINRLKDNVVFMRAPCRAPETFSLNGFESPDPIYGSDVKRNCIKDAGSFERSVNRKLGLPTAGA